MDFKAFAQLDGLKKQKKPIYALNTLLIQDIGLFFWSSIAI